jgi:hypothetical protein
MTKDTILSVWMKASVFVGVNILGLVGLLIYQSSQSNQADKVLTKQGETLFDNPIVQSDYQDCGVQTLIEDVMFEGVRVIDIRF